MSSVLDPLDFATETFGKASLGDARRTQRLVDAAAALASHPGASIPVACANNGARVEGFYKLIRNDDVDVDMIRLASFEATARAANDQTGDLLLVQDTTSVSPVHSLREELRTKAGSPAGFEVHTGIVVNATTGVPVGILGQLVWSRKAKKADKLFDVESEKWKRLDEQISKQNVDQSRLIRVADRESDIFDYIDFLDRSKYRFVLRAAQNRRIKERGTHNQLWDAVLSSPVIGTRTVALEQRGGQKQGLEQSARSARSRKSITTRLRAIAVEVKEPRGTQTLSLNAVHVSSDDGDLEWMLLTREPIDTLKKIEKIVAHYEARWLIERFHKAWKTGCKIEERRMGSIDNFLRIMAITAPIAMRILKIQVIANAPDDTTPATEILSQPELEVLWQKVERSALPKEVPSCRWAYQAVARIAGWQDSKGTGRVGLDTLWRGFDTLAVLTEGWKMAVAMKAAAKR